jgi:hypothetical protein
MRQIRGSFFLAFCCLSCGCGSKKQAVLKTEPAVTEVGTPSGAVTRKRIGPEGGKMQSPENNIELLIPAGALATETEFSLTPLSSKAPGAVRTYRLGPEGTTFLKPATVRFTLADSELLGSNIGAARIAFQDSLMRWRAYDEAKIDGNRVSVETSHLSDWAVSLSYELKPATARVKVNEKLPLSVQYCHAVTKPEEPDDLVPLVKTFLTECQREEDILPLLSDWSVDTVAGGNSTLGTVTATDQNAIFAAPGTIPPNKAVSVSVKGRGNTKNDTGYILMIASVTISDGKWPAGYSGSLQFHTKQVRTGTNAGYVEVTGTANVKLKRSYPADYLTGEYKQTSGTTAEVTSYVIDDTYCRCTASKTFSMATSSLSLFDDGSYGFGMTTGFETTPVSCVRIRNNPSNPDPNQPCSSSWSVGFQLAVGGKCTGGLYKHLYTDLQNITETVNEPCYSEKVPGSNEVTWTLVAE